MDLIINKIDYSGSIADGPGIRTVLYVQGCNQRCDGCHNPKTWDIKQGKSVLVMDLAQDIRSKSPTKNLTISGGEPLLQVAAVLELVKLLEDFNIALYTGLNLEDVPDELLDNLDYVKVGKYEQNKRCTTENYIGSLNQCFMRGRKGSL
jgi:anaerobic ribonucleoside-triphosphate reductase activating protein